MVNPWAGEVGLRLDGKRHVVKLTLGSLAELEAGLGTGTLIELVERFEAGRFSTRDVLMLIARGLTTQEIGDQLRVSANTVKSHTRTLFGKLGVHNRVQALAAAQERGVI